MSRPWDEDEIDGNDESWDTDRQRSPFEELFDDPYDCDLVDDDLIDDESDPYEELARELGFEEDDEDEEHRLSTPRDRKRRRLPPISVGPGQRLQ
jgi:hypothetical protein